ncbi:hypothetical protein D9M69_702270 [compost metagenome]
MPMARAASTTDSFTLEMPAYVPASSGGTVRITSAHTGGMSPLPAISAKSTSRPSVGSARRAPATATAATLPRPVCPI